MSDHPRHEHSSPRTSEEPRLVFPAQALEQARRGVVRPSVPTPASGGGIEALDAMIRRADSTLDRMQKHLDTLKAGVQNYRFPGPDAPPAPPPRAA